MPASLPVGVVLNFGWEWGDSGDRVCDAPATNRFGPGVEDWGARMMPTIRVVVFADRLTACEVSAADGAR